MKIVYSLFVCVLGLTFFSGCAETDNSVMTDDIDPPPEQLAPPIDIKRYPKGWVHLTDSDVAELLALELPSGWWKTKDPELLKQYSHADLLQTRGDTPHVRFFIEVRRNPIFTSEISITFWRTIYYLWPNENNKRQLEKILREGDRHEPYLEHPRIERGRQPTVEDVEKEHAALLEKHGDVPQVRIVVDFMMKTVQGQIVTVDEIFAFRQARFELDPDDQPNRVIFEAYRQAKADGLPLQSVNERKVIEEWLEEDGH